MALGHGDMEGAEQRSSQRTKPPIEPATSWRSHSLLESGSAGRVCRTPRRSSHWLGKAIDAYQRLGDRTLAFVARSDLAHAVRVGGEIDEAKALYRETLHDWSYLGNRGAIANQLECFGYLALAESEYERAATLLERPR